MSYEGDVAEYSLSRRLKARFFRVVVKKSDGEEEREEKYVGFQMEIFGCQMIGDAPIAPNIEICSTPILTIPYERGFLFGPDGALFVCDFNTRKFRRECWRSRDGKVWEGKSRVTKRFFVKILLFST